jgi:hypothetical protein
MTANHPDVFIVGLDDHQHRLLERLPGRDGIRIHSLLPLERLRGVEHYDLQALLTEAREVLDGFPGTVDGLTTFIDFPALEITAILAEERGLPGPGLDGLLRCSHKYWSRLLQREVVGDHIPPFTAFDPLDPAAGSYLEGALPYPFWIKPINAYRSHLAFRVGHRRQLREALARLREGIGRLADPLADVLRRAHLPPPVASLPATACIAEGLLHGRQFTVEGWVRDGETRVYGVVDSIREANRVSFARYEYPSRLPFRVQRAAARVMTRAMAGIGIDHTPFNAEFFWDRRRDHLALLEINPRISASHCELFEKVDGRSHQQVALDLALGRLPDPPTREGTWPCAAKFFLRAGRDTRIGHLPSPEAVAALERDLPGTTIHLCIHQGDALCRLQDQDSYSYELGWVITGGCDRADLHRRFREVRKRLGTQLTRDPEATP